MQVKCERLKLKEGSLRKVKEWTDHLEHSREELQQLFKDRKIKVESFFLSREEKSNYLILYYRADDIDEALNLVEKSSHPLDEYTRKMLLDVAEDRTQLEVLLDITKEKVG